METIPALSFRSKVDDRVHVDGRRGVVTLSVPSIYKKGATTLVVLFDDVANKSPLVYEMFVVWNPETVDQP